MASKMMLTKCFICSAELEPKLLAQHERECLQNMQDNLASITQEVDGLLSAEQDSNHSGSSDGQKKLVRCYICGGDFPGRFISIHEKQCKRKWESGLTSSSTIQNGHNSRSIGNISRSHHSIGNLLKITEQDNNKKSGSANNLKKSVSTANVSRRQSRNSKTRSDSVDNLGGRPQSALSTRNQLSVARSTETLSRPKSASSTSVSRTTPKKSTTNKSSFRASSKASSMHNLTASNTSSVPHSSERETGSPRFIHCDFCGKMFSIHSVQIHEKQCVKKQKKNSKSKENLKESKDVSANLNGTGDRSLLPDKFSWTREQSEYSSDSLDNVQTPKFELCYVCKKPYGSRSLPIHVPQCLRRMERERENNDKLPRPLRRDLPRRSSSKSSLDTKSDASSETSEESGVKTPTNNNEIIPTGENVTRPVISGRRKSRETPEGLSERGKSGETPVAGKANFILCQICGKMYGSASIKFHEPKCKEKVEREQQVKDGPKLKKKNQIGSRKLKWF